MKIPEDMNTSGLSLEADVKRAVELINQLKVNFIILCSFVFMLILKILHCSTTM